jgi:hypothetical protein
VADVPLKARASELNKRGGMIYTESLDKGFEYTYKVNFYTTSGKTGPDSNVVDFNY